MAKVFVLTHTSRKKKTRVVGVYTKFSKAANELMKRSEAGKNPLNFSILKAQLNEARFK